MKSNDEHLHTHTQKENDLNALYQQFPIEKMLLFASNNNKK